MTDSWQAILTQQQNLNDVDNAKQQLIPLPQLGTLQVTGEEAQSFLQNLLTNDVNALKINQSQLSGFCNAKGRLFSIFLLVRRNDSYQIVLPLDMCSLLSQRLSMYMLRSKVTISNISTSTACVGLVHDNNDNALAFPTDNYQGIDYKDSLLIKIPSETTSRYLIISEMENIDALLQPFNEQWQLTHESKWNLLDIEAGLATIYPSSKEMFTPQQVNLDLVDGVSFNKGCYPGQEIVARLHYLGSPNRRLFLAEVKTGIIIEAGSEVTSVDSVAGHIVCSETVEGNTRKLLISLKLSALESTLFVNKNIGITKLRELHK